MCNLKELCFYILSIIYIFFIFYIIGVGVWEITIIYKYENNELILGIEYNVLCFTFMSSLFNIINGLLLLWILINKCTSKTCSYIMLIINLCLWIWSIMLYKKINLYNDFYNIIIIQFSIFLIEFSIIILLYIIMLCIYLYNSNSAYESEHIKINDYIIIPYENQNVNYISL